MDNLHYKPFWTSEKNAIPGKNLLKAVKFLNLVENVVMHRKYSLTQSLQIVCIIVLCAKIVTTFGLKMVAISTGNTKI